MSRAEVGQTPREVRAVLRYVLLNARHHAAGDGRVIARDWIDPCSSGAWFDGWRDPLRWTAPWLRELVHVPRPTARARSWLLAEGWRRAGPIACDDAPGGRGERLRVLGPE